MVLNMVKVLFIVRKTRSKSQNNILYCRITANGISREFSTEEFISNPQHWNQDKQFYECPGEEGDFINNLCLQLKYRIKNLYLSATELIYPDEIIESLKAPPQKPYTLNMAVIDYIDYERSETDLKATTIKHHEVYLRNLAEYTVKPVYANRVDIAWAELFKRYLKQKKGFKFKTRASRHIEFFKKALTHAIAEKKIKEHGLLYYKADRDKKREVIFLTPTEVKKFEEAVFETKLLQQITDLFIYQIHTGVEYGNIWSAFEVRTIPNVGRIILGTRHKGGAFFALPYSDKAEFILQKYNYRLPRHCNATYNKVLKIIAEILGIKKHLTTHTGRKTFAMVMKANGWSLETVSGMLGHASTKTTETYYWANSAERLINEMTKRIN